MFGEPFSAAVLRIYVKNVETRHLASRDAYERSWKTPPQLLYRLAHAACIFVPARRCRRLISATREAPQSLCHERGQCFHDCRKILQLISIHHLLPETWEAKPDATLIC